MDNSAAFPSYDARVWVLEGGDAAVVVDLEECGAFDAVGCGAELPEFDGVGDFEEGEDYGYFVWVGTCAVGWNMW